MGDSLIATYVIGAALILFSLMGDSLITTYVIGDALIRKAGAVHRGWNFARSARKRARFCPQDDK